MLTKSQRSEWFLHGALVLGAVSATFACGCRTSTLGAPIAVVGDSFTEIDARQRQKALVSHRIDDAYASFGNDLDVLKEHRSGERYISFPTSRIVGKQSFYLVQVSSDDEIVDVQHWIEWHDGFEDTLKLALIQPKVIGKSVEEAEKNAHLQEPVFVFDRQKHADQLRIYDATNWTHLRTRLLGLRVDADGVCRTAAYFGVAGDQSLQKKKQPAHSATTESAASARDVLAKG